MKIDRDILLQIAALSQLEITPETEERLIKDMNSIVGYMEMLDNLDVEHTQAMSHIYPLSNIMREDEVVKPHETSEMIQNAPRSKDGAFMVPKMLD